MTSRLRHLACFLGLLLASLFPGGSAHSQNGAQYVYDQLGRLVGVIDPSGNAAAYSYDAVGNLLSITRYTASQVSVLQFTPPSGPVGTPVTISGTGFSPTISQDSVSFNGVSATVTSATANQIVTSVPSGATTGPLTVTTPNGSFTTTQQFTLTAATGPPTITGFSPSSGVAGNTLTITGTNFYPSTANDRAWINVTGAPVSNPSSTQLTSTVASNTGSGRVVVATPNGVATSTQDFYVPFGAHTASQIGYAGRIVQGSSQTVSLTGQIALMLFDSNAGGEATLQLSGSTFSSCTIYVFAPNTLQLTSASCSTSVVGAIALPMTGTYTIGIDPGSSSGAVTVGLNVTPPGTAPVSRPAGSVIDYSNPLSTNMVGLFLMNEGTGTTDGDLPDTQTATFSGTTVPAWNTSDPSIAFAGGGSLASYLNAGTDTIFDKLPVSQMTLVAKVYVSTLAAGGVAEKNDGNTIDSGFEFGWDSTGALRLVVESASADMQVATAGGAIQAGQWVQVAFTWDGTNGNQLASAAHLFVNGVEQTKASSTNASGGIGYANATNKPFRIGNASFYTLGGSLNGKMAYLAVYKGTILTTTQMNQLDVALPIH